MAFEDQLAAWKARQDAIPAKERKVLHLQPTGNCNTCGLSKPMSNKLKGVRVAGSFGKCVNPAGPCENPIPRLGIDGVKSKFKGVKDGG